MTKQIPVGKSGHFALVDDEDYDDLSQYIWHLRKDARTRTLYAFRQWNINNKRKIMYMHIHITGFKQTDHINHNGLDNQRSNLREANRSQNSANIPKKRGDYSSQYKGVTWQKDRKKWMASITFQYKRIFLGRFSDESMAAKAYDTAAIKYFGEFASINFPEE